MSEEQSTSIIVRCSLSQGKGYVSWTWTERNGMTSHTRDIQTGQMLPGRKTRVDFDESENDNIGFPSCWESSLIHSPAISWPKIYQGFPSVRIDINL